MDSDGFFDQAVADRYDDSSGPMFSPEVIDETVDFLIAQAPDGKFLEFGIGTGRIAWPLSKRGVQVAGIDMSQAMLDRLHAKPGAERIETARGDFATTRLASTFDVVYLVFNTLMNLTTQAAQVACFRNAAAHLVPGGRFVIEVMVPALRLLPPGQTSMVYRSDETGWSIDEYDVARQGLVSHHLDITDDGVSRFSIPFRYVWPAELDLMAEMSGMRLAERHEDWGRTPFTSESTRHVSVWEKTD